MHIILEEETVSRCKAEETNPPNVTALATDYKINLGH